MSLFIYLSSGLNIIERNDYKFFSSYLSNKNVGNDIMCLIYMFIINISNCRSRYFL